MAQPNALQQARPALSVKEVSDFYIRKNFDNLANYFNEENQFIGFKFFDLVFTEAEENRLISHGFNYTPQDVVVTKIVGTGEVTFNHGLFDGTNINLSASGALRVRFFVGTYWKLISTAGGESTDASVYGASSSSSGSSSFSNPMTAAGDMIYGTTAGAPARLAGGLLGYGLFSQGALNPPVWQSFLAPCLRVLTSGTSFGVSYYFTVSGATATAGATYTNNGATFTVIDTVTSANLILMSSTAAPETSGTLTKASGTGSDRIVFTYRRAPLYIVVHAQAAGGGGGSTTATAGGQSSAGAGGGGGGFAVKRFANPSATYTYAIGTGGPGGSSAGASGTGGGNTTFSTLTANGGSGGAGSGVGAGPVFLTSAGGSGGSYSSADWGVAGGQGGPGVTFGAGVQVGSGPGGDAYLSCAQQMMENIGNAVGAAGVQGAGGGGGCAGASVGRQDGGAGGAGVILVWEYWQ